jgi:hypothetical protein
MKLILNDLASIAQIISVPLMLLTWLVTRERFAQFWRKWRKPIFAVTVVLTIWGIWRLGWLEWLPNNISWPIWGLLLYSVTLVVIVLALMFLSSRRTAKPQDELTYHTIDLPKYNTHLSRHEAPQGATWLGGVKFYIPNEYDSVHHYYIPKGIKVQPSRSNESQVEQIKIDLPNIAYVWFLIVAGGGHKKSPDNVKFEGCQIGCIELVFNKGSPQKVPLVLGANIREWNCDLEGKREDLVGSLSDKAAREVWRGPEGYSVLDMLQVAVEDGPKDLARIRIVGEFGKEVRLAYSNFPSVNVFAITCGQAPS